MSTFGAGGTNAHIIIEEWPPPAEGADRRDEERGTEEDAKHPALIVLSAKNVDRLKEMVKNLHTYITSPFAPGPLSLHDVAYTLQVGRDPMEERLGLIIKSQKELQEKLDAFLDGKENIEDLYRGQVKRNKVIPWLYLRRMKIWLRRLMPGLTKGNTTNYSIFG